jgi:hypothetical protein
MAGLLNCAAVVNLRHLIQLILEVCLHSGCGINQLTAAFVFFAENLFILSTNSCWMGSVAFYCIADPIRSKDRES